MTSPLATTPAAAWADANRAVLFAELAAIEASLSGNAVDPEPIATARAAIEAPAAIDRVTEAFALSPFERHVLLACAASELRPRFAEICQSASGFAAPTFELLLARLPDAHFSATTAQSPLRRFRLIELRGDELLRSRLRIDERMLHALLGVPTIDARLAGLVDLIAPEPDPLPGHAGVASRLASLWGRSHRAVVQVCGSDVAGKLSIAAAACADLGLVLHRIHAADIPSSPGERELVARLWEREAVLLRSALVVEHDDVATDATRYSFIDRLNAPVLVSTRDPLVLPRTSTVRIDVAPPSDSDQRIFWERELGVSREVVDEQLHRVIGQFRLGVTGLRAAASEIRGERDATDSPLADLVWRACRRQARPRLEDLAQRIEGASTWDDLVLPPAKLRVLRDIAGHVRNARVVYDRWGFGAHSSRGLGITVLFAGASGTGKTMAAEVLARELDVDLFKIDLSQVVSKYIGETEKNLRRIFDAAEESSALLLFDEADALFGKRSEVKDSHDRYANLEVSYLLQRMEQYSGLAVLTTNMRRSLDHAFLRRLRFVVEFPFPDTAQRSEIWKRVFPPPTPLGSIDHAWLARLNISGGVIRTIALNAAFLAADAGEPVGMHHLHHAAREEYAKLEKPFEGGP